MTRTRTIETTAAEADAPRVGAREVGARKRSRAGAAGGGAGAGTGGSSAGGEAVRAGRDGGDGRHGGDVRHGGDGRDGGGREAKTAGRPLRRDAQRNRERILAAAAEVFAGKGLGASMDEIAAAAGIGIGTVYRRFPDKSQLIQALFESRVEQVAAIGEKAAADPDPWRALLRFLEDSTALEATDRGLAELLRSGLGGNERITQASASIAPLAAHLLRRAQQAGLARPDLVPGDLLLAKIMWLTVAQLTPQMPGLWRRYYLLFVESIKARPGEDLEELPNPPRSVEPLREAVSAAGRLLRR